MKGKEKIKKKMKNEELWLRTQSPRPFPGFAVVVVTVFDEIFDDFNLFGPKENQQPILGGHRFSNEK